MFVGTRQRATFLLVHQETLATRFPPVSTTFDNTVTDVAVPVPTIYEFWFSYFLENTCEEFGIQDIGIQDTLAVLFCMLRTTRKYQYCTLYTYLPAVILNLCQFVLP